MMFIIFIPLAILIGWLVYEGVKPTLATTPAAEVNPLEILNLRYVRGEIDKKEYDRVKKDLA